MKILSLRSCLVILTAMAMGAAPIVASTTTGVGAIQGFNGVQVTGLPDHACTSSDPFEDMPGMTLRLRSHGPLVVMFQGQFGGFESTPGSRAVLRFTVDGQIVGSAIAIANDVGTDSETFGFNAFSAPLPPGLHTVKVLWHTFPASSQVCVEERSLIVLRR